MEDWIISCLLVLSASAALVSSQELSECQTNIVACQNAAVDVVESPTTSLTEKCQAAKDSLLCMQNLGEECVSDVFLRIVYLKGVELMKNFGQCDLESEIYPSTADACTNGQRTCLFSYVDTLLARDKELPKPNYLKYLICQDLTHYINCRMDLEACSTPTQNMKQLLVQEEKRIRIDCVVPRLVTSFNRTLCASAEQQCLTLDHNAPTNQLCVKAQESLQCIVDVNCSSDVVYMIIQQQEKERLKKQNIDCDTDQIVYTGKPTTQDCKEELQECTVPYVDSLLEKGGSDAAKLCKYLNDYLKCLMEEEECFKRAELEQVAVEEKERMRVTGCEITAWNHGISTIPSPVFNTFVCLCALILVYL